MALADNILKTNLEDIIDVDALRDVVGDKLNDNYPDLEVTEGMIVDCANKTHEDINNVPFSKFIGTIIDSNVTLLHDKLTGECSNDKYDEYEKILSDIEIVAKDIINRPEPKEED